MVLTHISLMINNVENLFTYLLAIDFLLLKNSCSGPGEVAPEVAL